MGSLSEAADSGSEPSVGELEQRFVRNFASVVRTMAGQVTHPKRKLRTGRKKDASLDKSKHKAAKQKGRQLLRPGIRRFARWIAPLASPASLLAVIQKFRELWRGDRAAATWILAAVSLVILIGVPIWLAFSWKSAEGDDKEEKISKRKVRRSWRFPRARKLALVASAVLVVLALLSGAVLYREHLARRGKAVAVVADFDGPDRSRYRVGEQLAAGLSKSLEDYPEGIVRSLGKLVAREQGSAEARVLGERYHANLVIWGSYEIENQGVELTVHVEILKQSANLPLVQTGSYLIRGTVAQLTHFEIQQQLSTDISVLAFLTKGLMAYVLGNHKEAVLFLTMALNQREWPHGLTSKPDAHFCRGTSYLFLEDYARALRDLSKAIEADPSYAAAYYSRGYAYDMLQKYEEALKDYSKAAELDPSDKEAYNNLGIIYALSGDQAAAKDLLMAEDAFSRAIALDENYDDAYYNRAREREARGDINAAIADLDRAITINPRFVEAINERGLIRANAGATDQAIGDFSQAIKVNPTFPLAYYNRGLAYSELGQNELALADFRVVLAIGDAELVKKAESELLTAGVDPKATQ